MSRRFVRDREPTSSYDTAVTDGLRKSILQAFGSRVRKIILFGSRVRGDASPDSDYDVLVVFRDRAPEQRQRTMRELYAACRGRGAVVEPHPMSEIEFEETKSVIGGLAYPAAKEGVILYQDP